MTTPTREFIAERDARMYAMRLQGVSVPEIAKRFGLTQAAVKSALNRQVVQSRKNAFDTYPELLHQTLDRYDKLFSNIWPYCNLRQQTLPDGTVVVLEPDPKMVDMALRIMKEQAKLLGLEHATNINLTVDEPVKSSLAGAEKPQELSAHSPEVEARKLFEIMVKSGILPHEVLASVSPQVAGELESGEVIEDGTSTGIDQDNGRGTRALEASSGT